MVTSKMLATGAVLAAMAKSGSGLRRGKATSEATYVAEVPVFNYDMRYLQVAGEHMPGEFEWNLVLQKGVSVDKLCDKMPCKKKGTTAGVPFISVDTNEDGLRGLLKGLQSQVKFAEPEIRMEVPGDLMDEKGPAISSSYWHLDRMGVKRQGLTGKGAHIYVMDTGVRSTHQDFGGRAIPTLDTLVSGGTPVECNGDVNCATDYHGHGTLVASSAGGTNYGVAPESTLHAMKVCCGSGTNVLGGMDWIANNAEYPAIMTLSLAARGRSESSRVALDRVVAAGVTVTVGSANDNEDTCTWTYGFIPSAISVGATDSNDRRASFSNWGTCNDIYAPGVRIAGAWNDADTGSRTISGTSMATPMVAGASALLLQEDATRTPAKVVELLQQRSIKGVISDLQPGDPDMLLTVA